MAYSEADLDNLRAALASGVTRVTVEGRTVEYRSLAELREAIAEVSASLADASGSAPSRALYPETSRGF